ncbi:hypothetical protein OHB26_01610 [Nocardia sp. NBC_01503]|uniref:hypothetical protein n=1 Tax=Nocardia sp. NBC_01503 TaxID=2975997 RepID=UPI002E7B2469|nr:hypothetical protein [Nocardia sp. NBC_01503]WTL32982.1 hypothetical protein OHB26_01610 [Nocardia sp. NBC_01503]
MRAFPSHPGTPTPEPQPAVSSIPQRRPGRLPRSEAAGPVRRSAMLAGAATVLFSVAVAFAPSAGASAAPPVISENAAARVGILESTAAHPDPNAIAEDFVTEAGYRPVVEAGMLVNPGGDCSSPVPLPREFDIACKAHDLGYDMLRYADSHGQALGPWARQAVDAALDERMHASCLARGDALDRAGCEFMAGVAATFVDLNSIRQDYGVPVHEAAFDGSPSPIVRYAAFGLPAAVFAATAGFFARRARALRSLSDVRITTPRAVAL